MPKAILELEMPEKSGQAETTDRGRDYRCYETRDMMQAYDVKHKRIVNVERNEGDTIIAYSLPGEPGTWYFPLIENGRNVERYEIIEHEQRLSRVAAALKINYD